VTIETLIAEANPVVISSIEGPDSARARQILHEVVSAPRNSNRSRISLVASGVAAVGIAVALVTQVVPDGAGNPSSAAAAELTHLASTASALPSISAPQAGQFQYTESVGASTDTYGDTPVFNVDVQTHRQIWVGPDGSGRILETASNPTFPTAQDRANWLAQGSPPLTTEPVDQTFGPGGLTDGPVNLWTLPTDPTTLANWVSSRRIEGGPSGPQEDFVQVGDLLRETDAPPALRSALFQVASHIPGVQLEGTVKTQTGQSGVAVAYVEKGGSGQQTLDELIFDPTSSALIGTQDVLVNPATGSSTIETWTSYLASKVMNSTQGAS
jgi:hypothetical protein